jgi:hypothetical protein
MMIILDDVFALAPRILAACVAVLILGFFILRRMGRGKRIAPGSEIRHLNSTRISVGTLDISPRKSRWRFLWRSR